jgi:phosphatidate cytidylyltransferase
LKQRIITALILAPLVVLGIFTLPLPVFKLALLAITMIGVWEWAQFVEGRSRFLAMVPSTAVLIAGYLLLPSDVASLNFLTSSHYIILAAAFVWWIVASLLAVTYPKSTGMWQSNNLLRHLFGMLTLVPFFWSILLLRANGIDTDPYHGAKLVMFVCLLVWTADSGAYFAGKAFGKHKMAPNVSPNKTLEGLMGGTVAALVVGWIAADWFEVAFNSAFSMFLITLCTVVISVLGDLVESMFKRVSGIKDSSNIIPGHGGILDRIDSLTAAFPVFTLLYFLF